MKIYHTPKSIIMAAILAVSILAISVVGSTGSDTKETVDNMGSCSRQTPCRTGLQVGIHTLQMFAK